MTTVDDFIEMCRVTGKKPIKLKHFDPAWAGDGKRSKSERKQFAVDLLKKTVEELAHAQELLYAADTYSVLMIFQAMDAAGKDGTIAHVMSGVNPQGCQVYSFKHPSAEELDHDFLWRSAKCLPERGRIGIFNRSYYEEVLIVKVHQELVQAQRIPDAKANKDFWQARYESINAFERHLTRNGTVVLKFFLNVSKDEQRRRFLDRLNDPAKHWKFASSDLAERGYWDDYQKAYEQMINATSSKCAPWYVIPADHKWVSRALVASVLAQTISGLHLSYPEVTKEKQRQIVEARKHLEAEGA